jgi:hypothetical protein
MKLKKSNNLKVIIINYLIYLFILLEGEEILTEISGTAKIIKKGAIQIRDEIHLHDPLLSDLEKNVFLINFY